MSSVTFTIRIILYILISYATLGAIIFLPAGTLDYWEGWVALLSLMVPMTFAAIYFMIKDPALMKRRMKMKEKETVQKGVIRWAIVVTLVAFIIPGLDHRFDWSTIPTNIVIFADVLVFIGYAIVFRTLQTNSYAARTIEVEKDQKVITTGPYAIVRHPMYAGMLLLYYALPIGLGSYWAALALLPLLPIMIIRTLNEETVLKRDLPGYKEYCKKVKYRLIPGIW